MREKQNRVKTSDKRHRVETSTDTQSGRLYLVGIGPGDPELMTCKAVRILQSTQVWVAPKAKKNGSSSAVQIASGQVELNGKEIVELCFPMKKVRLGQDHDPEVEQGWHQAAETVLYHLEQGRDVAFPTLGDPSLYSTAFYLLAVLQELRPELPVTIIPGITAMAACSIVPAAFDDERLRGILKTFDAVVLMKVFRKLPRIIGLLDELGLTDQAVLIERCGMEDQRIYTDIREAADKKLHYFTTLLVRKKQINGRG